MTKTFEQVVQEIEGFSDREERAELLIELAEEFQSVPQAIANRPYPESAKVPGCESDVYVFAAKQANGQNQLYFAVENPQGISAKALAAILSKHLVFESKESLAQLSDDLVLRIFGSGPSMGKGQGLINMFRAAKSLLLT